MTGHDQVVELLTRHGIPISKDTEAAALAGFGRGYLLGEAAGRDAAALECEQALLDQDEMMDEIARRHTAQMLQYADGQRLAASRASTVSHLQLTAIRNPHNERGANAAIATAARHHQRVWAGWPGRTPA